jgi:hypothetical protein
VAAASHNDEIRTPCSRTERSSPTSPPKLFEQYAASGGELYVCPICFDARKLDLDELVANARIAGATPLWQWVGDGASVFSF